MRTIVLRRIIERSAQKSYKSFLDNAPLPVIRDTHTTSSTDRSHESIESGAAQAVLRGQREESVTGERGLGLDSREP